MMVRAKATFEVRPARHSLATAIPWVMAVALFSGMRQGEVSWTRRTLGSRTG